jgi:uncharacterized protein YggU (UPF0235/DUF167 family)
VALGTKGLNVSPIYWTSSKALNVPLSAVRIVSGLKNRTKRIAIAGVPKARIAALIAPGSKGAQ